MADGGEGTIDALAAAVPGAKRMLERVHGPTGGSVEADWLLLPDVGRGATGVVELAASSGITLLDPLAPLDAHTIGFGQLIRAALAAGVERLILAIGGSASTDGGTGALSVLGAKFTDGEGALLAPGGGNLVSLAAVDFSRTVPVPIGGAAVLSDVTNPLLGPSGAASVFGPQKGATPNEVVLLEEALGRLAALLPVDPATPGAGAAGGTGFGLLAWGAKIESGAAAVAAAVGLGSLLAEADIVLTGEGSFDAQSEAGKVPSEVAAIAARHDASVMVIAGRITADVSHLAAAVSLIELAGDAASAQEDVLRWLEEAGRIAAGSILS
jgi:glycerate kinase